eukprot:scaffold25732_cov70-Phaeocystis_antarctica.AAC.1
MAGRWMVAAETARVSQGGSTEATLQVGGSAFSLYRGLLQRKRERALNHQCVRRLRWRDAALGVGHLERGVACLVGMEQ